MESATHPSTKEHEVHRCPGCHFTVSPRLWLQHTTACCKYQAWAAQQAAQTEAIESLKQAPAEECPDAIPDVASTPGFTCSICGVILPTKMGLQIHHGRLHKHLRTATKIETPIYLDHSMEGSALDMPTRLRALERALDVVSRQQAETRDDLTRLKIALRKAGDV